MPTTCPAHFILLDLIILITVLVKSPPYALSLILSRVQILSHTPGSKILQSYKSDLKSSQQKIHNVPLQIRTSMLFDRCATLWRKLGQNIEVAVPSKMLVTTYRLYSFMNLTASVQNSKFQSTDFGVHTRK
jgi:hypothetical protein